MNREYKDLLSAFQSHGVRYLIVGGFAVIYHAQPRFTKDLDIFIKPSADNSRAIHAALAEFGAALDGIEPDDFADRESFFRFGREPRGFDLLPAIPGVEFETAWERRVVAVIDPRDGMAANFISAEDPIESKRAAGRPQDLADVDAILKAMASGGGRGDP